MKINYRGFTIIEVAVVLVILVILSGIIMFSVNKYIAKGKDSSVQGNLAVLIPGGEVYYNGNNNSYINFCDPAHNSLLEKTFLNMPINSAGSCFVNGTNPEYVALPKKMPGRLAQLSLPTAQRLFVLIAEE